ncbi:MAG: lactonase family protein [Chthoniobacteraceae bacterium]
MKATHLLPFLAVTLFAALAFSARAERTVVYVSNGGSKDISLFDLNPASGELTARGVVALEGNPGPLAISPDRKFLYAALRQGKSVQTLRVNPADGSLTAAGTVVTNVNPAYLIVDRTGRNLLAADYGGDRVTVHRIAPDGTVEATPVSDIATGRNPHSILTDRENRFVFSPLCGADKVLQFRFDPATGKLAANEPADVGFQPVDGPRHMTFHPTKPFAYVVNEKSSSMTALAYDAGKGTLKPLQTLPTLPQDFAAKNSCADIHITPDGKYVYGSNRGHDSLAGYAIDQATGKLTSLGQTPTEKTPRSFAIDPTGKFIFAAGQGSHRLASYRIDSATGALHALKTYETGQGPAWVLVVQLSK